MPSILIIGAGAVGAFFGSALARQGAEVSVVCRSDYAAVSQHGYRIRSAQLGDHTFTPHRTFDSVEAAGADYDYVILTTKVTRRLDRTALLRPAVSRQSVIVLMQNGVGIEAEVAAAFPDNELLSAIAFIGVGRTAPGEVHHQSTGSLTVGRFPGGIGQSAETLAALFEASGVRCKLTSDVATARWQKALWNAAFNPISILGAVLDTEAMLRTEEDRAFIRATMLEIAAVAAAAGRPLDTGIIDKLIETTLRMPPYKTTMVARKMGVE
jgi:2-dehydropantoate 2-reductase